MHQVAEFLCDTELAYLEHEVAVHLSNLWRRKFDRHGAYPHEPSGSLHGLSSSLRSAILSQVSLHDLVYKGPADLQAEAIAAQVSPGNSLTVDLPAANLLPPRTLFSALTFLASLSLDLEPVSDCRWLSDLFQLLPIFTSLCNLSLSNFLRGPAELSMLLHSLSKLSTLTSLSLLHDGALFLDLPRPIQTPLLPALPSLHSLHLHNVPIHLLGYSTTPPLSHDLALLPSLSSLRLTHATIPPPELHHLLSSFSSLPALHDLSLDHAHYLPEHAHAVLRALRHLTACSSLSLAGTKPQPSYQRSAGLTQPAALLPGTLNNYIPAAVTHLDLSHHQKVSPRSGVNVAVCLLQQLSASHAAPALRSLRLLQHCVSRATVAALLTTLERTAAAAASPLLRLEVGPMTGATREAAPRFAAALAAQTALTRLSLCGTVLNSAQLARVLRQMPRLLSLAVLCAPEAAEHAQRVPPAEEAHAAAEALTRLSQLTELSTNWPRSLLVAEGPAAAALGGLRQLSHLRIERCKAEGGSDQAFAEVLGSLATLESLHVLHCGLFAEARSGEWLAGALRQMTALTSVWLMGGPITDAQHVEDVVGGLQGAWGLRELKLAVKGIPLEEIVPVAQRLPCKAQLVPLSQWP
eukprot:jgi/Ulvmu1/10980/UM007_0159.1